MNFVEMTSDFSVAALVVVSLAVSAMYFVRVIRHSNDPLRWALLGVLLSLAVTNLVPFMIYMSPTHELPPVWVGWVTRAAGTIMLLVVTAPLVRDTVREVLSWICLTFKIDHARGKSRTSVDA